MHAKYSRARATLAAPVPNRALWTTVLCARSSFPWSVPHAPPDDRAALMIGAIFRKDWALLWPLVLLVTLIQIALEWAIYKFGFFGASPFAREVIRLLTPAWYIGVIALAVAVV